MEPQAESMEKIEDMQVDSIIWTESDSLSQVEEVPSFQIYTVSKSIKNPKILEHIKPDYGSLGEFMKNVAMSKDILMHNRKKKNEQQEDIQQKKLRTALKDKNLEKILKCEYSSQQEKSIASKMMVESMFENKFGMGLNSFCSQNSRQENHAPSYLSIGELADTLDDMMIQKKSSQIQFETKNDVPVISRQKNMFSSESIKILTLSQRVDRLRRLQQQYPSLRNTPFSCDASQYSKMTVKNGLLLIENCNLSIPSMVGQIAATEMENIKTLKLSRVAMQDDIFCLMLDYFTEPNLIGVQELIIEKCQFANMDRISQRVKQFIEETKVMRVDLDGVNLSSHNFCIITLGVGARSAFEYFGLRNNDIGFIAKKCLDVLLKFHRETQFNFSGNPIEKDIRGKSAYSHCFA